MDTEKSETIDFLKEARILVVDPRAPSRRQLIAAIERIGASPDRITSARNLAEASERVRALGPGVILCEHALGDGTAFDLLRAERKALETSKLAGSVFALVSTNTSQRVLARAAEEEVDAFIVRPFTIDRFRQSLAEAIELKLHSTPYLERIEQGKAALAQGQLESALHQFSDAIRLEQRPALACFHKAQAKILSNAREEAIEIYRAGLGSNNIHYKSLIGLFELLQDAKRLPEAYELAKRILENFPTSPQRLSTAVHLAVHTRNFLEVEGFYPSLEELEQPDDEVRRTFAAALAVVGKKHLQSQAQSRALEVFDKIVAVSPRDSRFLAYIVRTLIEHQMKDEAKGYFESFPAPGGPDEDYRSCTELLKT